MFHAQANEPREQEEFENNASHPLLGFCRYFKNIFRFEKSCKNTKEYVFSSYNFVKNNNHDQE